MRAVGLVPHRERPGALDLARQAAGWFARREVEVRLPPGEAAAAGLADLACDEDRFAEGLDLVVSLGGDGTMLHTVQLVYPAEVPVLGVNAGQMGYLTALEPAELEAALPRLLAGDFEVSERMVLELEVRSAAPAGGRRYALNEVILEKVRTGHLVRLEAVINGSPFTTYAADGVIVATPTGSTAYSFSVRGPIASPDLRCLIVSPVAPHMLFDRSLLLAPDEELELVVGDSRAVAVTVDGRELGELASGDAVTCRAAPVPLRVVTPAGRDFHQLLKAKFQLPDR